MRKKHLNSKMARFVRNKKALSVKSFMMLLFHSSEDHVYSIHSRVGSKLCFSITFFSDALDR